MARARRERLRGEERDEQIRSDLEPLAPGERPGAVTVAALIAATLGLANLIAFVAGAEIDGRRPEPTAIATFCAVMAILAIGMWLCNYWIVLAFQALLTIVVIVFCLFALRASDIWGALVCTVIIVGAGWLFWKLVRAMARMQMQQAQ